jgi:hypothetical protein
MFPDCIAIGTATNTVCIAQGYPAGESTGPTINYSTNTITLASPMTWAAGAPIWLYSKSDGVRILYGAAPDIGASAFQSAGQQPPAPQNVHLVN